MQDKSNKLYNVDNIEFLRTLPDKSTGAIVSDVPYGLQDIDALKLIKENTNNTRGFMNKAWDVIPTVDFLKECNRVLKDGAFFITTFSPRQDLQCVFSYRLLEAGFDINFTPILWCFQTGFPKASDYAKICQRRQNIPMEVVETQKRSGKGFNKTKGFGYIVPDGVSNSQELYSQNIDITKPTTPEAKYLDGLKSCQLKPAYEVVLICQKPYKAKSKIDQALVWYNERKELLDKGIKEEDLYLYTKNASGGVRIDKNEMFEGAMSSRIPTEDSTIRITIGEHSKEGIWGNRMNRSNSITGGNNDGRFPATILVENNCLDVGRERKSGKCDYDAQSDNSYFSIYTNRLNNNNTHADQGDLSRYFSLDAWTKKNLPELYKISKKTLELQEDAEKISPFLFTSKADKGSKNAGLEGFPLGEAPASARSKPAEGRQNALGEPRQNTHPTGKPISLYAYLINLFTFPHDLVLDPYCGSGTTPIACILTNRHYIGLELEKEYFDFSEARVKYWKEQKECQENKTSTEEGTLL